MKLLSTISLVLLLIFTPASAQTPEKPLVLPFIEPPGIHTWLLGQAYGNTTGAYNFGDQWYSAGQGLHFGLDFSAPCGTPLAAVADGVVRFVDNLNFGSAPHNLILQHPDIGLSTLYGHLQSRAPLAVGDVVEQGQLVGFSGDPDGTCESRPHLHLEIRSLDYFTAYNPIDYIDANWESLALVGRFGSRLFQTDLDNARRWQTLDDQPDVAFGGRRLNNYAAAYPPTNTETPPANPPLALASNPITQATTTSLSIFDTTNCCWEFWWHPTNPARAFTIDGAAGQRANVFEIDATTGQLIVNLGTAPPPFYAPDYSHIITPIENGAQIQSAITGELWTVQTGGWLPAINTDNTRLMWVARGGDSIPGQAEPDNSIIISDVRGNNQQILFTEPSIEATWLDANRLLLNLRDRPYTQLDVYNITTDERYTLGRWYRPRAIQVAPGGGRLMFYLPQQPNPAETGTYWMDIAPDAVPQRVTWFGAYKWRDANTLLYIPFDPTTNLHQLHAYDVTTGADYRLTDPATQPFTVLNGRWSVNADGSQVVFRNARDRNLWRIQLG